MFNQINIMIDLETMSLSSNASIISIGAVVFNADGLVDCPGFLTNVTLESSIDAGLDVSASTIEWWLQQEKAAQASLFRGDRMPLKVALEKLKSWIEGVRDIFEGEESVALWGNGSDFDLVVLKNAYNAVGYPAPWEYNDVRCYRTLKNLFPEVDLPEEQGIAHNALDDALFQAKHAVAIAKRFAFYVHETRCPSEVKSLKRVGFEMEA